MSKTIKINIKKDDTVLVLSGDDKGKKGRVLKVYIDKYTALVEGVNIISRHTKPNAENPDGGIIKKEGPVHLSNLSLLDPKSGKSTRVGRKEVKGKKVRFAKKSGEVLD